MSGSELRRLDPSDDLAVLDRLCRAALPERWHPKPAALRLLSSGLVAVVDGLAVGAVAHDAAIQLLVVDPAHQGRGVGSALLEAAVSAIRTGDVSRIPVGSGGRYYLWPGVPADLPTAAAFFSRRGWHWGDTVVDLVADVGRLVESRNPDVAPPPVTISSIEPSQLTEVRAFEEEHFPDWLLWFQRAGDVMVARSGDGPVVAALLRSGPGSDQVFWPVLGPDSGSIGCVGVHPDLHGQGVGSALVAAASRDLAARGVGRCHISWVARIEFYRRLGYEIWAEYTTGWREA